MRNFANRSPPEICPRVGINLDLWALFWKKMMMMMMSIIHNFISHRRWKVHRSSLTGGSFNLHETVEKHKIPVWIDQNDDCVVRFEEDACVITYIRGASNQTVHEKVQKWSPLLPRLVVHITLTSGDDALSDIYSSVLRLPSNLVGRQWMDRLGSNSIWIKPWHMKEERVHITRTSSSRLNLGSHLT